MASTQQTEFPCTLSINIPFPTARLASTALQALSVDPELSPLVTRQLSVVPRAEDPSSTESTCLKVDYHAATNRMLRVSVNTFMESLRLVIEVMEHLDEDVIVRGSVEGASREAIATS